MTTSITVLGQTYDNEDQALQALQAEQERLQTQKRAKEEERLQKLAGEFGLDSVDALIARLAEFASPALRRRLGAKTNSLRPAGSRGRLTPATKSAIIAALKAGRTSPAVAAEFGVSVPTVSNLKKTAGLVRARGENG
jgi:DNA-binding NarL/FixJ family response regulator